VGTLVFLNRACLNVLSAFRSDFDVLSVVMSPYAFAESHVTMQEFVKNAVSLAMWRDGSSGGVIRTVTISKDGVEREMVLGMHLPLPSQPSLLVFQAT
jgi:hypothetical protein